MLFELLQNKELDEILAGKNIFAPFALYGDRTFWNGIPENVKEYFKEAAQKLKNKSYGILPATLYMDFTRIGNRDKYEKICFERRADLMTLTLAECIEGQKEYIDDIINLVWAICEETSWVAPAHNNKGELPDIEYEIFVDLFSAETASAIAWTYYFLGSEIGKVSPTVKRRAEIEVDKRILSPYLQYNHFWYMGLEDDDRVNNWNPWINSNVIVAFAVFEKDKARLIKGIEKTARSIDGFINSYNEDGACDEGPGYFGAAGAALFDYLEILSDITDGKINIFGNELIKNMARYIYRVYIGKNYYVNFADGSGRPGAPAKLLARIGAAIEDENLTGFANYITSANPHKGGYSIMWHVYRGIKSLFQDEYIGTAFFKPHKAHWFKDTEILTARDSDGVLDGMFIAIKGGNNDESHNHNDVGSFVVYSDAMPIIIDAGVETYTKKTFSAERYDIWTMQSCWHSLPTVNGYDQRNGKEYCASDVKYNHDGNITTLSMQLKNAYPKEADIKSYAREFTFEHGKSFTVCDKYIFGKCNAPVIFNAVCYNKPVISEDAASINLGGGIELAFDSTIYSAAIEEMELTDSRIKRDWERDFLYRIKLTAKEMKLESDMTVVIKKI